MNIYRKKNIIKKCFMEFFGTGLVMFFGIGCLAASKLTNANFTQFEISCIWGFGVSIAIYFSSSISGAHLNPAVTIFFWLSSKLNKRKVLPYIISQTLGSFFFTMLTYYLYNNLLISFERNNNVVRGTQESLNLASIFCVYPNYNNSFIYDFIIEIFSTALFILIVLEFNNRNSNYFLYNRSVAPILTGFLVCMINLVINPLNNISLNPARDLGPKILLSLTGWGLFSFTGGNDNILYCFIPIMGPILGANLGGWIHKTLINNS
ncbi:MIP/aquaporin family protein [Buchnera aphidicola str. APS (Acyrthosiphon pisum)]|uniref:Glycerol uptake facilitator protein n=1 Tax=Buchnera aphidicola subsp. Acyrthosiphon pisum (strain APS) TaxID=107806 RepID=GLPF_BUCAI|nr:MIP/aquaporin family protein [Buchnera aphidicola]P57392.1 RecName: Full=Glycerol uptake facilitator protein [Buchnera aphidicola str. APS (Acyrthosiphon pisum)]pir/G84965/ glycerol uptake facilitator protein [imported] - Buchnera sp. (strain APS) [Buchnera sp. (in: enterobacteria)]ADP66697.1 glycerol uptake facilitator protein [Buchnera aphidicola str. TLW03 (Acyrthosiphon pisum)]ACL30114.1 glycerol uptake facilitator protein [Buchnera aphidicola str. Tuc7 (Acyrthosiphon pisum)]ADP66125.1 